MFSKKQDIHQNYLNFVDRIVRRMPEIGAQLDHPVAEVLYTRMCQCPRARKRTSKAKSAFGKYAGLYFLLVFVIFLMIQPRAFRGIFFLLILAPSMLMQYAQPRNSKSPRFYQPCSFFLGRDQTNLHDLWLTDVSYQSMAAIEVLLKIAHPWRGFFIQIGFILWNAIAVCALWFLAHQFWIRFPIRLFSILSIAAFWNMLFLHFNNDRWKAMQAIEELRESAQKRAFHYTDYVGKAVRNMPMGCLRSIVGAIPLFCIIMGILFISNNFSPANIPNALVAYGAMIVSLITVGIAYYTWDILPDRVRIVYDESCKEGEELFPKAVHQENERATNS